MTLMLFLSWCVPLAGIGFYAGFSFANSKARAKILRLKRQISDLENPEEK